MWSGYKYFIQEQFGTLKVSQTVSMRRAWKIDKEPDKRDVITECPYCEDTTHPLLKPFTIELEHKRTRHKNHYRNRIDKIIYGVECSKCKKQYKFELICDSFMYAKLGQY